MNFDLSAASEKKQSTTTTYQKPGIYDNVKIASADLKVTANGTSFLQFNTVGSNGEVGKSTPLYLTTAAWPVTARRIVDLLVATHNVSDNEAKAMISVETNQQLLAKTSALLVNRPFRAKFNGEETAKGSIIAVLDGAESMSVLPENTKLWFSEKSIKKYQGTVTTESSTPQVDPLPF